MKEGRKGSENERSNPVANDQAGSVDNSDESERGSDRTLHLSWREIVQGVIIGVTVAVILGIYDFAKQQSEENSQVRYIREIIVDGRDLVYCAKDMPAVGRQGVTVPAAQIRHLFFQDMENAARTALSELSERVRYREKRDLIKELDLMGKFVEASQGRFPRDIDVYDHVFNNIADIEWLGIQSYETDCSYS